MASVKNPLEVAIKEFFKTVYNKNKPPVKYRDGRVTVKISTDINSVSGYCLAPVHRPSFRGRSIHVSFSYNSKSQSAIEFFNCKVSAEELDTYLKPYVVSACSFITTKCPYVYKIGGSVEFLEFDGNWYPALSTLSITSDSLDFCDYYKFNNIAVPLWKSDNEFVNFVGNLLHRLSTPIITGGSTNIFGIFIEFPRKSTTTNRMNIKLTDRAGRLAISIKLGDKGATLTHHFVPLKGKLGVESLIISDFYKFFVSNNLINNDLIGSNLLNNIPILDIRFSYGCTTLKAEDTPEGRHLVGF